MLGNKRKYPRYNVSHRGGAWASKTNGYSMEHSTPPKNEAPI